MSDWLFHPYYGRFVFLVFCTMAAFAGFLSGGAWLAYRQIRRERARRDEASRFDPGDKVTFGDGSYVVVRSCAGENGRPADGR